MHVGGRQTGAADGGAVVRPHDPLGQQEVAEQTGYQQILAEQFLEEVCKDMGRGGGDEDRLGQHLQTLSPGSGHLTGLLYRGGGLYICQDRLSLPVK